MSIIISDNLLQFSDLIRISENSLQFPDIIKINVSYPNINIYRIFEFINLTFMPEIHSITPLPLFLHDIWEPKIIQLKQNISSLCFNPITYSFTAKNLSDSSLFNGLIESFLAGIYAGHTIYILSLASIMYYILYLLYLFLETMFNLLQIFTLSSRWRQYLIYLFSKLLDLLIGYFTYYTKNMDYQVSHSELKGTELALFIQFALGNMTFRPGNEINSFRRSIPGGWTDNYTILGKDYINYRIGIFYTNNPMYYFLWMVSPLYSYTFILNLRGVKNSFFKDNNLKLEYDSYMKNININFKLFSKLIDILIKLIELVYNDNKPRLLRQYRPRSFWEYNHLSQLYQQESHYDDIFDTFFHIYVRSTYFKIRNKYPWLPFI